jgi:tetratricopeptide (TPR) repeat protein
LNINWRHILVFVLVICGAIYVSIPTSDTLVEMTREADDLQKLMRILHQRIENDPRDADACLELAELYRRLNDPANATKMYREANRRRPGDPKIQYPLALALVDDNEVDEALELLPEKYRDRNFMLQVVAYYDKVGDLQKAEETLLRTERDYLDNPQTWLSIARWRSDDNNLEGECEALRKVIELDPENPEAWERYFLNRAWELDSDEAIRAAHELEKLGLMTNENYETLFEILMSSRDTAGAVAALEKMAGFNELNLFRSFEYAVLLYRNNEYDKADAVLLRLMESEREEPLPEATVHGIVQYLRESAEEKLNLPLALKLAEMPVEAAVLRANRLTALRVALERDDYERVVPYLREFIDEPGATADVILMGINLAYRGGDFELLAGLFGRLKTADNPYGVEINPDGVFYTLLENPDKTLDHWRAEVEREPDSTQKLVCLSRAAVRENKPLEAARAVDLALPRLEAADFIDAFGLLESLLFLDGLAGGGGAGRPRNWLEEADRLAEGLAAGPLAGNRAYLALVADLRERQGKPEAAAALWERLTREYPEESSSWLGLGRFAAARGDGQGVAAALARLGKTSPEAEEGVAAEEIRGVIDICETMNDFYRSDRPEEADRWLDRAWEVYRENRNLFPDSEPENVVLEAGLVERRGDWDVSLAFWKRVAELQPDNLNAWLGLARAQLEKKEADAAWDSLLRAKELAAGNPDLELELAGQLLEAADAAPEDSPVRAERRDAAFAFGEERLGRQWDPELASTLVWWALEINDLAKARDFLSRSSDYATPAMHASLAEAYLAAALGERDKTGFMPGDLRESALSEALAACAGRDRDTMMRAAYVLSEVNEKERLREVLGWIEGTDWAGTPDDLTSMIQLADAYSVIGDFERQYALAEKRARLGGEPEWLDAIDRHVWNGDFAGALRVMGEAGELFPDSGEIFSRELSLRADDNRPGLVIAAFERVRKRSPGIAERLTGDALAAIAESYEDLRSTPQARRFYRLSLERQPANKRGSMGAARLQRRDGNLGGAILRLQAYAAAEPDDPWGWLELANYRAEANQVGRAEYLKVVELTKPDESGEIPKDVVAARAVALRQLGREKEALALLEGTIQTSIESPDVACDYAQMLMELGRYDEAEKVLRDTVALFPYHVWAYRLEATVLVRRRRYDLAVARLKEALAWAPDDGEVQRDLGFAAQMWERTWKSQKNWLSSGGR